MFYTYIHECISSDFYYSFGKTGRIDQPTGGGATGSLSGVLEAGEFPCGEETGDGSAEGTGCPSGTPSDRKSRSYRSKTKIHSKRSTAAHPIKARNAIRSNRLYVRLLFTRRSLSVSVYTFNLKCFPATSGTLKRGRLSDARGIEA
ncbi:MAG TPA: hypothetical protein DCG57_11650 [Candidatus Riflebacteria bacterium]|nr:hypothetical protein [Candidatus Riflebacteria bacterium]